MADENMRYIRGNRIDGVLHALVTRLTKLGLSLQGSRVLHVRGRTTGEWRSNPVNLLVHDGERYLVAPRGHTHWVRNLRTAGTGRLQLGRRVETFTAQEVQDREKPAVLRAYLKKWKWEVGMFFDGVGPDSPDEDLLRIASGYPVFRIR